MARSLFQLLKPIFCLTTKIGNENGKESKPKQNKRVANNLKIGQLTSQHKNNNDLQEVSKKQSALLNAGKTFSDNNDLSSDDESIDISEKANRIEGAGGNDFHYFCKICK